MQIDLKTIRGDILGGITAAVVAIPIGMAFGIASGMGILAGLYGAVALCLMGSIFGGTKTQISGPTAPMTVAMTVVIATYADGSIAQALVIVVFAGVIQVLLGLSRIGRFVVYTPYVVISGFMTGIGLIIVLVHLPPILGAETPSGGAMGAVSALPEAFGATNLHAVFVALVTIGFGLLWPKRFSLFVPAPLVGLIVGSVLGLFWLTEAPRLESMPIGLPSFSLEFPSASFLLRAIEPALILALLGSVDSLLTSLVADSMTGTSHNSNRELIGQGLGNITAGLIGGLPGAGTTTCTVTNIVSNGTTRLSGIVCGTLILSVLLWFGKLFPPIPLSALAGVMVLVGLEIVDWNLVKRLHRVQAYYLSVVLLTCGLTIFVDLVTAVAVGLIVAGLTHAAQLESLELDNLKSLPLLDWKFLHKLDPDDPKFDEGMAETGVDVFSARVGLVEFNGIYTVASSRELSSVIGEDIKDHEVVIFDFSKTVHIDDSVAMVIVRLINVVVKSDTHLIIMGLGGSVADTLNSLDVLQQVPEAHVVGDMDESRELAAQLLEVQREKIPPS
ncbi:MAG: SulP family inorganic anion transporter [Gammaproteobacteria bacterium]|nr:SulP family inorganic anion transporter [Gammaproteobacteria bacterium]MYF37400.1 SulP family inorganic anion transporter [Gammaproteobacteria bacterium]